MASNRDLKVTFGITSLALIRPGDTLVLSFGRYIDAEECKRVSLQMAAELPGVHVTVIDQVTHMAVYRPDGGT